MTSSIAWLDFDSRQNARMSEILSLFEENETLDDLGIGNIRDGFADLLFPGTSTVQTRLRYFHITAWIYRTMEREHVSPRDVAGRVDAVERDLIGVFRRTEGARYFGRVAGRSLKVLPSAIYWNGLVKWGVVHEMSRAQYHRQFDSFWWTGDDDSESAWKSPPNAPAGFPHELNLKVTADEADFLRSRICASPSVQQSALRYLVTADGPPPNVADIWLHPQQAMFDDDTRELIAHAQVFSVLNEGASALYNLMLAKLCQHDDWVDDQRGYLRKWMNAFRQLDLTQWDLDRTWELLEPSGYTVDERTRRFVGDWAARVIATRGQVEGDADAEALVQSREEYKKGGRSRFKNAARRDRWKGGSPPARLDYRWRSTVYGLLDDLHRGLRGTDAGTE